MDDSILLFLPMWRDVARSSCNIWWGSTSRTGYPRSWTGGQTHTLMGRGHLINGHWPSAHCSTFDAYMASDAMQEDPRDIFSDVDL